jgi:ATP-dependent DNA helicase
LKNLNCRLIKELKQYHSANRLLITGTPLQNNLAELWSLLNFLMPEVFDTLENFESFFDFSSVLEKGGHKEIIEKEQKSNLIASLHAILKPFLLRRVKTDVETGLPKKREYILYAPLTSAQKELYKQILEGNSRKYLEQQVVESLEKGSKTRSKSLKRVREDDTQSTPNKSGKSSRASTPGSTRSGRKATKRKNYAEVSDTQFFKNIESRNSDSDSEPNEEDQIEIERAKTLEIAKRTIANKKLQNPVMQLRLACNSPHNFYWPWGEQKPDRSLITSSGKLLLLDRLVPYLFARNHKVLIFSQFTSTLDILETWASTMHNWPTCRIDGSIPSTERGAQIKSFNSDPSVKLFLLSTRAGGQGINLAAADTVILFDSDWNPQQDLQAQDRAHRIGQTRPVIVYRLATKATVEQTLLERAEGKRRLEKLVIRKGKFKNLKSSTGAGSNTTAVSEEMDELARILEQHEGEGFDVDDDAQGIFSEDDLHRLTDRSDEAYARAERGEDAGERFLAVEARGDEGVLEGVKRKGAVSS